MSRINKMNLGRHFKKAFLTLTIVLATAGISIAQGPDPNNPDCGGDPGGGPNVPLNGGVVLLIAGGITYAAFKMRKEQLKRKATSIT